MLSTSVSAKTQNYKKYKLRMEYFLVQDFLSEITARR